MLIPMYPRVSDLENSAREKMREARDYRTEQPTVSQKREQKRIGPMK